VRTERDSMRACVRARWTEEDRARAPRGKREEERYDAARGGNESLRLGNRVPVGPPRLPSQPYAESRYVDRGASAHSSIMPPTSASR
jgi:hypothetical protein